MTRGTDEPRIAVVFRADIDMPRGKSEVQFGHAVAQLMRMSDKDHSIDHILRHYHTMIDYMDGSQLKLSMEVDDLAAIQAIAEKANARGVRHVIIQDAGRTVFPEPTVTCIGLGPMNKTDCNALTRRARMRT